MTENSRTRECGEQKVLPSNVPVYTRDTSYASGPRVFSICTSDENIELGSSLSTTLNCLRKKNNKKQKYIIESMALVWAVMMDHAKKTKEATEIFFFFVFLFNGIFACTNNNICWCCSSTSAEQKDTQAQCQQTRAQHQIGMDMDSVVWQQQYRALGL